MKFDGGVTPEQRRLLQSSNHGFGQLLSSDGRLSMMETLQLLSLPVVIFVFTMLCHSSSLRFTQQTALEQMCKYGLVLLLAVPTVTLVVFVVGVLRSRHKTLVSWPAVVYWGYWPLWKAALCWAAMCVASQLGNYVWFAYSLPNLQLAQLQVYTDINPAEVSGLRLQDAGIVDFTSRSGVDRAKGGCLRNGAVYCIAPIISGGDEFNASKTAGGAQDLFMAGKDCCSCSGENAGEFRCGDWNKPISAIKGYATQIGGLRVVNQQDADFYRLAAQDWAVTLHQEVKHAVFFEWVDGPALTVAESQAKGQRLFVGSLLLAPVAFLLMAVVLRGIFSYLRHTGNAVPTGAPIPVGDTGLPLLVNKHLLPAMHADHLERQAQLSGEALKYSVL